MSENNTQNLAERIALLLQDNENGSDDFSFVRASLEKINERLDKIEDKINSQIIQHPAFSIQHSNNHPSREKFTNLAEIADEIFGNSQNEKACPYEPTGKPCDHCAMCNSRGF